ncbi:hypothetical protein SteCoe_16447 [Stentor coeruleus]|uniref:DNA-directed RNA polymerase III subunit RPC9 n=1 Tax=Stentor coeruleus TaxID=5963 RepID=A0A1R2C1C8_9CILI|nr:hypothetical protein SteCoe_16447 [Stentor coeruleus]
MNIVNIEALGNYEVFQALRCNRKYRKEKGLKTPILEREVREYLKTTNCPEQKRHKIEALMKKMKEFGLYKQEVLQIINLVPQTHAELYLIIANIEERFQDSQVLEILDSIKTYL